MIRRLVPIIPLFRGENFGNWKLFSSFLFFFRYLNDSVGVDRVKSVKTEIERISNISTRFPSILTFHS